MKNAESTPLFDCPLHALLTDLGFPDGDNTHSIILFELLEEYLKSIGHPSMRRPEEASR